MKYKSVACKEAPVVAKPVVNQKPNSPEAPQKVSGFYLFSIVALIVACGALIYSKSKVWIILIIFRLKVKYWSTLKKMILSQRHLENQESITTSVIWMRLQAALYQETVATEQLNLLSIISLNKDYE